MSGLPELIQRDLEQPPPADLDGLLATLRQRYGASLRAVVVYGSCRRDVNVHEGLVDLLVLVDRYRNIHSWPVAMANSVLPPNVYFLQSREESPVRCKYAVITVSQFARRCRSRCDHYFWARFTQPCRLLWAAEPSTLAGELAESRAQAARSFCRRVAPLRREPTDAAGFWEQALAMTYRCELRPEPPGNARRLISADPEYWQALTQALAEEQDNLLVAGPPGWRGQATAWQRGLTAASWRLRQISGKAFNLLRLFKAAGTFSNGIDYITWKVERHSGVRVEPTERMRRHPRLAAWGLAWKLWRQGGFR